MAIHFIVVGINFATRASIIIRYQVLIHVTQVESRTQYVRICFIARDSNIFYLLVRNFDYFLAVRKDIRHFIKTVKKLFDEGVTRKIFLTRELLREFSRDDLVRGAELIISSFTYFLINLFLFTIFFFHYRCLIQLAFCFGSWTGAFDPCQVVYHST